MASGLRLRVRAAYVSLVVLLVPIGYFTLRAIEYQPPKPLAPEAVALVRQYLGALQAGDLRGACRLFELEAACAAGTSPAVNKFSVSPAEPTVDGVQVPATIDEQQALFELTPSRGTYRIVDIVADPVPPSLREFSPAT